MSLTEARLALTFTRHVARSPVARVRSAAPEKLREGRGAGHLAAKFLDKGGKLTPRFKGPFLAERMDTQWNYRIKDRDGNTKIVHLDQLKECHKDDQPLAAGLRGRGRPRRIHTILVYNSNRKRKGEV